MTGCHKNVCFDDESYRLFLAFLTVGKMVYGTYFLPTGTNLGSISLSLHVRNFLIVCRVAMVTQQ